MSEFGEGDSVQPPVPSPQSPIPNPQHRLGQPNLIADLLLRQPGVEGDQHPTHPRDGVNQRDVLDAAGQAHRHPIPRLHAPADQPRGKDIGQPFQFGIADRASVLQDGQFVGGGAGTRAEPVSCVGKH